MRALSLMYHDVFEDGAAADSSGFPGPAAASYKLGTAEFAAHLAAIARVCRRPVTVHELAGTQGDGLPLLFTFDDGGASALHVADMLEERGWRGHFFVTTDYIGTPAFASAADIRELGRRGHVIGSHSCSHPTRMARCSRAELDREWSQSLRVLSDLLGTPPIVASVPGGHYSVEVARAAAAAGVKTLFTSEPTTRCEPIDGCIIMGRFTVQRWTSSADAAALASGDRLACTRQLVTWNIKKTAKAVAGDLYLRVRNTVMQ